ncbi:hypothetical protein E2C01_043726 [Portunus trituberculatus]|uniref:Uncharacterized protein n=1 Tax=Portunus trituberculatus TaxID=210409 RepID=A0A5B7FR06_PORTR|nr:hypothetical protein [Portunus trituberculatus]
MTNEYLLTHSPANTSLPVPRVHVLPQLKTGWYYKQYTTDTTQQMMGAHSRLPKHTGDHSHQQQQRDETIMRPSALPHPSGQTQTGNAAPTGRTVLRTTSPLSYTATVYRVTSQLLKGGHNSQTED